MAGVAGGGVREAAGDDERKRGDQRRGLARIDGQGREQGENEVLKGGCQLGGLLDAPLVRREQLDTGRAQGGNERLVEERVLILLHAQDPLAQRGEIAGG